jgi:nucleosome binding factor SPN SPT16 subunit
MSAPAGYSGAKIEIVERDIKTDQTTTFVERAIKKLPSLKKVGIFMQDKDDGDLTQLTKSQLQKNGASFVEMKDFVDTANTTKTSSELINLKTASDFAEWTFKKIIGEVETILENDKVTKHSSIQKKIEGSLDDDTEMASFLKTHPGLNTSFLEYPIPVLIQSGSNFALNKF